MTGDRKHRARRCNFVQLDGFLVHWTLEGLSRLPMEGLPLYSMQGWRYRLRRASLQIR